MVRRCRLLCARWWRSPPRRALRSTFIRSGWAIPIRDFARQARSARCRRWTTTAIFNRVVAPRFLRREGDLAAAEKAERETLPPLLDYLEGVIPEGDFLVGDALTLADIAVASPFVNLAHCGVRIDPARYPKVVRFTSAILARPSFAGSIARETAFLASTA